MLNDVREVAYHSKWRFLMEFGCSVGIYRFEKDAVVRLNEKSTTIILRVLGIRQDPIATEIVTYFIPFIYKRTES